MATRDCGVILELGATNVATATTMAASLVNRVTGAAAATRRVDSNRFFHRDAVTCDRVTVAMTPSHCPLDAVASRPVILVVGQSVLLVTSCHPCDWAVAVARRAATATLRALM